MASFFELEGRIWPEGADAKQIADTVSHLLGGNSTGLRRTRSATARLDALAKIDEQPEETSEAKADRKPVDFHRSPKRSVADVDHRRAVGSAVSPPTADAKRPREARAARASAASARAADEVPWDRLLKPPAPL